MTTAATVARPASSGQATHTHTWRYLSAAPVARAGSSCAAPVYLACRGCPERVTVDCKATRAGKCEACAAKYRDRVRLVAKVPAGGVLLLTTTAPGNRAHYRAGAKCPCTPDGGVQLGRWNATAGERWNRLWNNGVLRADGSLCQACDRGLVDYGVCRGCSLNARYGGVRECLRPDTCGQRERRPCKRPESCGRDLRVLHRAYFRATEVQDRGALHFHVLLAFPDGAVLPPWVVDALRELAIGYGFGHELDLQAADPIRSMHYVAKYVTKSSGARQNVPWVGKEGFTADSVTGEVFTYRSRRASYRTWSASRAEARRWHRTMRDVVTAQTHFAAVLGLLPWSDGEDASPWEVVLRLCPTRPDGAPPD